MQRNTISCVMLTVLLVFTLSYDAITDNVNLRWKKSWTSPPTTRGAREVELEAGVYVPGRAHPFEAWFDIDGDGNLEMIMTDNDFDMTYIYENAGDDTYEYRWFFCMFDENGASILNDNDGRLSGAVDMDGDGADEFYNIGQYKAPDDPLHSAALKIWKHEPGSAEFLPPFDEWTVEYDEIPSGRDDKAVVLEYYGGCGDWDNDGNAEIALNYKNDPAYYFGMLEVVGPVTQDGISFNMEVEIPRKPYMIDPATLNTARTFGKDLDNDGFAEMLLTNRNDLTQCAIYLDCNGEDDWTQYEWNPDMPRVFPDSIRNGENFNYADIDGDGVYETFFQAATGRGNDDNHCSLWVTRINPLDPANLFSYDAWAKLKNVEEMLGYPADTLFYTNGAGCVEVGDADNDNLTDVYFSIGATGGCRLMDVEYVGTDYKDPSHYNYYAIVHCPSAAEVDSSAEIQATLGAYGDGDKDGLPDIAHNNNRSGGLRPALYVWEYGVDTHVESKLMDNSLPKSFDLQQNYPNPFNPTTTISYSLDKTAKVRLDIYNINGKLVKTLVNGQQVEGHHKVTWDSMDNNGSRVSSGIYFYSLVVNSQKTVKKMTLIK